MDKLNVGCGATRRPGWTNADLYPQDGVICVDIRAGLPFPNNRYDVIYASHVLEHISYQQAKTFLNSCHRVLRDDGIIRIVVPDLEEICRLYLRNIDDFRNGEIREGEYDWILVELLDQLIRVRGGGEMIDFARRADPSTRAFIQRRVGDECLHWFEGSFEIAHVTPLRRIGRAAKTILRRVQAWLSGVSSEERSEVYFRRTGQLHRWMYDEFSLGRLLVQCGFTGVTRRTAIESYLPQWSTESLDTDEDGNTRKPDSLFMEARAAAPPVT